LNALEFRINDHVFHWKPQRLLIAGYTGRNQEDVKRHIDELKEVGVPAPPMVPMIYDLSPDLLMTSDTISVVRKESSGEVEIVLLDIDGNWYVGIGSDHTDRVLETVSIQKSKQVCQKPISKDVWPLELMEDHWDEIELRSWVVVNGKEKLYQSGTLEAFLQPKDLLEMVKKRNYDSPGMALFCGTLPLVDGEFIYGDAYRAELYDRKNDKKIKLSYEVKILKDAEAV